MPPKVLIVEDNAINLNLARTLVVREGHDALMARDVMEAQKILDQERPDMVLLDIQLPGPDGVTLLRSMRADPVTKDLPVVAMTAYAMRGDEEHFLAQGFDGYLSKPIDTATFGSALAGYLDQDGP